MLIAAVPIGVAVTAQAPDRPGQLDPFFGGDGRQTTFKRGSTGYAVAIDEQRSDRGGGLHLDRADRPGSARFLPNGMPDTSFSRDGQVTTDLGGTDYGFDVAIHPDGGIAGRGRTRHCDRFQGGARPLPPRGKRNRDFGGGDGIVLTSFGKQYQGANASWSAPAGDITIGGFTSNGSTARWALARFGPRGTRDRSFGGDGRVTVDLDARR